MISTHNFLSGRRDTKMMIAIYYDRETADEVLRHEILLEDESPTDVLDKCWQWLKDAEDEFTVLGEIKIKLV